MCIRDSGGADVEAFPGRGETRARADRFLEAAVAIFRGALPDHPWPDRRGAQAPPARRYDRDRLPRAHPAGRAGSGRALAARDRALGALRARRCRAHPGQGRRSSPVAAGRHRAHDRSGRGALIFV